MKANQFFNYGEDSDQTKYVILCSSGISLDNKMMFYIMERPHATKAINSVYFSPNRFKALLKSGKIKPRYKTTKQPIQ